MALKFKEKMFNIGTGAGGTTVAITGIGFTPVAALFFVLGRTENVDTGGTGTGRRSFGFAANTTQGGGLKQRAVGSRAGHAIVAGTTGSMRQYQATDSVILSVTSSSGSPIDGKAKVNTWDADGATLGIVTQFVTDLRVLAVFIGGNDAVSLEIVDGSTPSTGTPPFTQDYSLGFTCQDDNAVGFVIAGSATTDDAGANDSDLMFGVFTSAGSQFAWTSGDDSASTSTTAKRHLTDAQCFVNFGSTIAALNRRAQFDSWITNGFRWQWNEVHSESERFYVLVIKGGLWKVKSGATAASLTTVPITGAGFAPIGGLVVSHATSESGNDAIQAEDMVSVGAFTGAASRGCQAYFDRDGQTTTNVAQRVEHDEVYAKIDTAGALVGLMDVQSMDSDGVTFVMDDADDAANFFASLLVGSAGGASTGGGGMIRRRRR